LREAFVEGAKTTYYTVVFVITSLAALVRDLVSGVPGAADQVAGPVGIYSIIGDTTQMGFAFVVFLVANLSVVLAVMNFLPIPALDGGRIVLLAIEAIKGKPISQKISNGINTAGFVFLMLLMLLVTYKDIARLVG
jgi:regulator of sigma E protease